MAYFIKKTFNISLILLGLGVIFLAIENLFYQYIDNEGFLHESIFMPLGAFSIMAGVLFLLFFIIQKIFFINK